MRDVTAINADLLSVCISPPPPLYVCVMCGSRDYMISTLLQTSVFILFHVIVIKC